MNINKGIETRRDIEGYNANALKLRKINFNKMIKIIDANIIFICSKFKG